MSETSYTALQGKVCVVTLKGSAGTNYCWCLTSMPKELALFGTDRVAESTDLCGGTYQEHFYFLVKGSEDINVELNFELTCMSNPTEVAKTSTVKIRIIPANSNDFAPLDTVAQVENVDADALLKYGYACGAQDSQRLVKYGYVCDMQDSQNMAKPYGFPLIQDRHPSLKYGYPCGVQDNQQLVKYGYPCGVQDSYPNVMYGYPRIVWDSHPNVMYGYPCGVQDGQNLLKYGYPCGVQDN